MGPVQAGSPQSFTSPPSRVKAPRLCDRPYCKFENHELTVPSRLGSYVDALQLPLQLSRIVILIDGVRFAVMAVQVLLYEWSRPEAEFSVDAT